MTDRQKYPPDCDLCAKGFPLNDEGMHYGTQSLGMIPNTVCCAGGAAFLKEIAERIGKTIERSEHIERALLGHTRDGDFGRVDKDIKDLRNIRLGLAQIIIEHRDYIIYGLIREC